MLNFNDISLDFNNFISSNVALQAIFGNLILTSIFNVIVVMIVDSINDGQVARFIYSFIAVFCCILVTTKIIKSQYTSNSTKDINNQFSNWMSNNTAAPVVIPKKVTGSAPDNIFQEEETVQDVSEADIDNFLYSATIDQ